MGCGTPFFTGHVDEEPFSSTTVGSQIAYQCQSGLLPEGRMTSVCRGDGRWDPNPATLMCEGKSYTCNQVALLGKLTFVDMHMILRICLMLKLPSSCREVGMHIAIIYAIHQVVLNILTVIIKALRWLPQLHCTWHMVVSQY